jgi:hypothetical protein
LLFFHSGIRTQTCQKIKTKLIWAT